MFKPVLECMTFGLQEHNREDLVECLPCYVMFRIGLGMLQPRRIDDVWESESMRHNPYLVELFPNRWTFYVP